MTDDAPSPTTRMPVPESPSQTPTPPTAPPPAPPPAASPSAPVTAPRRADRDDGRTASILFGLVFLGLGLWFFAEHTLGYDLPHIRWSQLWPVLLIVIGVWVVLGSMRRGSR